VLIIVTPMKKHLQAAFDALLFSNVFMALCAVAQGLVTFHIIGSKPVYPVLALLFASTLGLYNFCILIIRPKRPETSPYRRVRWFFAHHRLMVTMTIACLLGLVPLFFLLANSSKLLLVGLAVLSFGYGLPLFTTKGGKSGLRNVPGLKAILITLVWTLSCVLLPIFEAQDTLHMSVPASTTSIILAKRFLFIAALTVPFDIRDLFQDRIAGLKTIPVAFGEQKAYLFCQFLLAGHILLLLLLRNYRLTSDFFALTTVSILTGWLIFKSTWQRNEYYYFFFLDGVLILQYVALVVFEQF
jgi:4-hydroxybenzoate polyprenyltransferase